MSQQQPTEAQVEAIVQAVIERAEQACRYVVKRQNFEGESDFRSGFEVAGGVCEKAIADHVRRHLAADLAEIAKEEGREDAEADVARLARRTADAEATLRAGLDFALIVSPTSGARPPIPAAMRREAIAFRKLVADHLSRHALERKAP